ncbi:MAG: pantoate--beta-alanine ligase [Candidatus Acidoferrales bacterium]
MKTFTRAAEMQTASLSLRRGGKSIGFVPTMGALHEGHLSLVRRARQESDVTVASVFVNPAQFGPAEDYRNYPRDPARDAQLLEREGVDFLFAPPVEEMYPPNFQTYATVEKVSAPLEGEFRPGHFRGVATVVLKLFNIIQPHRAYFGQKDAQQCVVIRRMVRELNLPVEIVVCPIVREPDGLALSSRNYYLNGEERRAARVLYRSLCRARELIEKGERRTEAIVREIRQLIDREPHTRLDYVAVVHADTLEPVARVAGATLIPLAVWIGRARLLDNLLIEESDGRLTFQL